MRMRSNGKKTNSGMAYGGVRCVLLCLAACCLVAAAWPSRLPADEAAACPDHVWITCGEQIRLTDGSLTQRYGLKSNGGNSAPCTPDIRWEAYYRLIDGTLPGNGYRRVPLECGEGTPRLEINCRTNARLELIVVGRCSGRRFTAQLRHALFGKASAGRPVQSASPDDPPGDLRRLELQPSRRNFYMQTGDTYRFAYHGNAGAVETVEVLEEGRPLPLDLVLAPDGSVDYTPAHDPRLDRKSPYTFKETVLLAREVAEDRAYVTTFTLLLHRSYGAHLKSVPGLAVFAGAAVLVGGCVAVRKRRPWYR
jgi:hypothetical protein